MDNTRLYVLVRDSHSSFHKDSRYGKDEHHHYNWYLIQDDTSQGTLSPTLSMAHKFPYHHTLPTCLGSTIFMLGGCNLHFDNVSSDFWYFDTNDARSGWMKGPSLHVGRSGSCVIPAEGNLYVFGGTKKWYGIKEMIAIWCEVYDMESKKWSLLTPPNPLLLPPTVGGGVVLDLDINVDVDGSECKKKKDKNLVMLLYLPNLQSLLSYQLATKKWETFDSYFGSQWAGALVISSTNNILLAINYNDNLIYGYHIMRKGWFAEPIGGLDGIPGYGGMCSDIQVLSLGSSGKLCLVCSSRPSYFSPIHVCCAQFTVYEIQDGQSVTAKVETTREFTIDNSGDLCYCVALLEEMKVQDLDMRF